MVIKNRIAKWRKELFDSIAAAVGAVLTKFLEDFRSDARAELEEFRLAARAELEAVARKADEGVDKLTDAIPGTLDDKLLDGRFGQLLDRLERLTGFLGGGR